MILVIRDMYSVNVREIEYICVHMEITPVYLIMLYTYVDHPTAHEEEMDQGLCNGTLDPPREVIDLTETDDEEMEQRARPQYYYSQSMSTEAESTPNDRDLPNNELDSFHDILQSLRPGIRFVDLT